MAQHRALDWLHEYGRRYPKAWEFYARWQCEPPMTWPAWCWCPMAAAVDTFRLHKGPPQNETYEVAPIAALAAWRATQGIYRVHPTLLAELLATPITGDIPSETLMRLPEWCVYVEVDADVLEVKLRGFFAHLEFDKDTCRPELRLVFDTEAHGLLGHAIHLGGTLLDGVRAAVDASVADYRKAGVPASAIRRMRTTGAVELASALQQLVSVVLYLCADDAEIEGLRPLPPKVIRGAKRPLMPAAKAPLVHETGLRIGGALDAATTGAERDEGGGVAVTPHVRRAHWHAYWMGPRDGARRVVLRWLSPILVGFDGVPEQATVRPVGAGI
jgi:hypothetical protein